MLRELERRILDLEERLTALENIGSWDEENNRQATSSDSPAGVAVPLTGPPPTDNQTE